MQQKTKAILRYSIDVVLMVYFIVIICHIINIAPSAMYYDCASFYLGVATGLSLAMIYWLIIDILKPIVRYTTAKIRKQPIKFVDTLDTTK